MLGVGGAEPPYGAASSTPGRRQGAKARRACFLAVEMHENWLEATRYLNMDHLKEQLSALGKMRATWVRRFSSWFNRSSMLVDFMCLWCGSGSRTFKLSNDPKFAEKLKDVVGLCVDPPAHAVVLSIDEKSQVQALDRTQPGLPIKKGRCATTTHDYKRNGTTTLFADLDVLEGKVIGRCT